MLKTIIVIILIAGALFASVAICAYVLKVDFAIDIMNTITAPFNGITTGNLDLQTVASGASLATAATSAIGWIKSNKDKALALKENAEQQLENSGLVESVNTLTDTKKELESQITQLKNDTQTEVAGYKEQIAKLTQENKNLQASMDTLNALVPKIQKEKEIIKVVQ